MAVGGRRPPGCERRWPWQPPWRSVLGRGDWTGGQRPTGGQGIGRIQGRQARVVAARGIRVGGEWEGGDLGQGREGLADDKMAFGCVRVSLAATSGCSLLGGQEHRRPGMQDDRAVREKGRVLVLWRLHTAGGRRARNQQGSGTHRVSGAVGPAQEDDRGVGEGGQGVGGYGVKRKGLAGKAAPVWRPEGGRGRALSAARMAGAKALGQACVLASDWQGPVHGAGEWKRG